MSTRLAIFLCCAVRLRPCTRTAGLGVHIASRELDLMEALGRNCHSEARFAESCARVQARAAKKIISHWKSQHLHSAWSTWVQVSRSPLLLRPVACTLFSLLVSLPLWYAPPCAFVPLLFAEVKSSSATRVSLSLEAKQWPPSGAVCFTSVCALKSKPWSLPLMPVPHCDRTQAYETAKTDKVLADTIGGTEDDEIAKLLNGNF